MKYLSVLKRKYNNIVFNLDFISFWIETDFKQFTKFVKTYISTIDSYSIYTLELFNWSLWKSRYKTNEDRILENFEKYKEIVEKTYLRYEISNFAKKWYESKHNQVYWEMKDYLWLGTSASWFVKNIRYTNSYWINNYLKWNFSYQEKKILTKKELLQETIFLWLRTNKWVKLSKEVLNLLNKEKLDYFIKEKYLKIKDNYLHMQNTWYVLYNYIITEILEF
jgi:oxygen-independent coproporphyrinogen-3 oxidase